MLLRKIRTKGIAGTCRAVADRVEELLLARYYEWRLGITTSGRVSGPALGYADPDCHAYGASTYGNIRRILRALEIPAGSADVLIDFGAGKGRVLALAAREPFARVIGVERSADLAGVARVNLERAYGRLAYSRIEVVTADAAEYVVPDDATVIYFASPFGGAILDTVLRNIQASLDRAPRRLRVVSHGHGADNPFDQRLRACGWLTLTREVRLQRSNCAWIYTSSRGAMASEPATRRSISAT